MALYYRFSFADFDFMHLRGKPVLLVRSVTEGHHGRCSAPAPGLEDLSINDHQIRTILS